MKDNKRPTSARTVIVTAVSAAALVGAGVVAANGAEGFRSPAQTSVVPPVSPPVAKAKPPKAKPKPPKVKPLSGRQMRARGKAMRAFVARNFSVKNQEAALARLESSPYGWRIVKRDAALRSFVAKNYGPALRGRVLAKLRASDSLEAILERNGYSF